MDEKVTLTSTIVAMEVGEIKEFPIVRCSSVQSVASLTGLRLERYYKTRVSRQDRVIRVMRVS